MSERLPRLVWWLAVALVTAWFASRWPAAWYGYPFEGFQDEPYLVDIAHAMVRDGTANPRFFNYPSLTFDLLAALFAWGDWSGALPVDPAGDGAPGPDHFVWARLLVLVTATLTVPVTAELGRRLAGPLAGLAAACFLAVAPLFTTFSYLATVNPPLALWSALAGLTAAGVLRRGARADYLLAGAAAGLALGTKYVAFPAALLAPLAHLLAARGARTWRWRPLFWFGGVLVAVFLATSPYVLLDFETFRRDLGRTGEVYDFEGNWHFHEAQGQRSWGLIVERFAARSFRPLPHLCALAGLGWLLVSRTRAALLLVLTPLLAWAFLGSYKVFFPRNLMGALPFVCVFAGAGLEALRAALRAPAAYLAARLGLRAPLVAGLPLAAVLAWVLSNPLAATRAQIRADMAIDTRRAALEWIQEHVPPGARLLREERTPPLEELLEGYDVRYVRSLARPDRLDEAGEYDYVLLTVPFRRDMRQVEDYEQDRALYERFMARHRLAAEFEGGQGRLSGRKIAIYATRAESP